ncbi:MAG: bifunctional 5,10-methylenetetrahydrofolate dehydrogenase/5,10-methenyltetrahydrofolate cyclohydrolase [Bacteroidota bacterium]
MAILLDGKAVAQQIRQGLAQQVRDLQSANHRVPHLAIVLIGDNPASHTYVHNKIKACHEVGFQATCIQQADLPETSLVKLIGDINHDNAIDGLIVQLPLPQHISAPKVIDCIKPEKDVDGLHPLNYGRMARSLPAHIPATPLGILTLLAHYQIPTQGKHCVLVGRGAIVGTPLSMLLSRNAYPGNATVTFCHSYTQDLDSYTRQADILVVAVGKPKMITAAMVQQGAVVIDVGITRVPDLTSKTGYGLQGDVDFEQVAPQCSYITPVPGGVGPMTIAALLGNTLRAAQKAPSKAAG